MSLGMSYDQYWYDDVWIARAYLDVQKWTHERIDYQFWLQGRYVYEAILRAAPILIPFSTAKEPLPYIEKPYTVLAEEEKSAAAKIEREKAEATQAKAYMMQMIQAGKNWGKGGK